MEINIDILLNLLIEAKCPNCDGSGVIVSHLTTNQYVTRDMAIDAGDKSLEGSLYSKGDCDIEPCQWCDERNKIITSLMEYRCTADLRNGYPEDCIGQEKGTCEGCNHWKLMPIHTEPSELPF